ncbi:MAG: transposase [Sphaerochaetaceae bacterium]|nr:transposase [Sphaerochaetaceae bacterium]
MPRRARQDSAHSVYHVIQRGNNRSYIYEDIRDKRKFISILTTAIITFEATLLHWVIMDNHYHLLIRTGDTPLSGILWFLNRQYTVYYNQRYHRSGTIYGGRYKSYPITETAKLYSTVRYIVQNPVKAGMVTSPRQYRWSGHAEVLDGKETFLQRNLLDRPELLRYFAVQPEAALRHYLECTESDSWSASIAHATIIDPATETAQRLTALLDRFLYDQEMFNAVSSAEYRRMLLQGSRAQTVRPLRDTFIHMAVQDGHSLKDIARFLSVSYETVRRTARKSESKR